MSEIGFYHLQTQPLERALPRLLEKVLQSGARAVVRAASRERVEALNTALWTYGKDSFLPHGSEADGFSDRQPIYLTAGREVPNGAAILVLVDGADAPDAEAFQRCLDMFDGNDEAAVEAARRRWRDFKAAGHRLTYWQQTERGGWHKAAGAD
ncbi:DNA polymerase III subunit chi [Marinivivus vitaminiproducens]|uniref:DNA polymerase III subunit chi n=1 Tax=Marinivivus vitaminiproducens TaxID=3035935 RepID=UPI0027A944BB|nr:DNA polymerase III subunit chi [Geminicoccaceae bacterium SCSIO 64248]